ncbi:MAG: hypothetical protein FJW34_16595 [Acidobacteria bacterium]|nr:hypothetical protein [Acidobacteriota bacterium]
MNAGGVRGRGQETVVSDRIEGLVRDFSTYLRTFQEENPFSGEALRAHTRTVTLRRQLETVRCALGSDEFLRSLCSTLESFGMNQRGARLVSPERFSLALRERSADLAALEERRLDGLGTEVRQVTEALWRLIDAVGLTETRSRLVAATKALHHFLPRLAPPMDRAYTGAFVGWSPQKIQGNEQQFFKLAFPSYAEVAERVQPEQHVGDGWNTGIAKVVDNAVVGYCKRHHLDEASRLKAVVAKTKELGIYDQIVAASKSRGK